jgi:hypothetical protein
MISMGRESIPTTLDLLPLKEKRREKSLFVAVENGNSEGFIPKT